MLLYTGTTLSQNIRKDLLTVLLNVSINMLLIFRVEVIPCRKQTTKKNNPTKFFAITLVTVRQADSTFLTEKSPPAGGR